MKSIVVTFFTVILVGYLISPSIICLIDTGNDIAMYIDFNEEEENKEEAKKDIELKITTSENNAIVSENYHVTKEKSIFSFKMYISKHLEVNTPPPKEFI